MGSRLVIDVTRLMSARGLRATPTGIDRVAAAYAAWALRLESVQVEFVSVWRGRHIRDSRSAVVRRLAAGGDRWCMGANGGQRAGVETARRGQWIGRTLRSLAPFGPRAGDVFISPGHSGLEFPRTLGAFQSAGGRNVVFVHDLIPLRFPEYCRQGEPDRHARRMQNTLKLAEAILVNSVATREDLLAFAAESQLGPPPVHVAPLGVETLNVPAPVCPEARRGFVAVGTIEGRKNHVLLLKVWSAMIDDMGDAVPHLAIVGRRGWRTEAFDAAWADDPRLSRFITIEEGLADRDVVVRVSSAAALLSPSFAEGYNLPVMEALAMGTPAIISDIPVHRELFGGYARLLPPDDPVAWRTALLEAASGQGTSFPPIRVPTWDAHFASVGPLVTGMANG